jgi:IS4 transposase
VLRQWLLLSNLPVEVSVERAALWYYWRWRVERYFKLLK